MINFTNTQDTKPLIRDNQGNEYHNFLEKDINIIDFNYPPSGISYYVVSGENAMRADLIAQDMYGFIDPVEKVLKFNNISNPLSINEGDILVTYDLYSMTRNARDTSNAEKNKIDVRDQYLSPEKRSRIDPKLQAFDKRNAPPRVEPGANAGSNLPPNYADFGDQEIQIRNGKLHFGPNITTGQDAKEEPIAKSEFIARLVKNRIANR